MHFVCQHKYLIIIFLAGTLLRGIDLTGESIWVDEGRSMALAKMPVSRIIQENANDNHPPLYYIFLHYWIKLLGTDELSGRLPALILGILSIPLIYLVGRRLFNYETGLYAAAIFCVSVFQIQYAQEIKTYAAAVFFTLISFYSYLNLRLSLKFKNILLYIVSTAILLYTHFLAIPVVIAQNFIFITDYLKTRNHLFLRAWIVMQAILLLLFAPWLPILFQRTADLPDTFWLPAVGLSEIPKTLLIYAGTFTSFGLIALLIFIILVSFAIFPQNHNKGSVVFLSIWFTFPILIPLAISFLHAPIYITRITIAASLPFYILAGKGIERIRNVTIRNQIFAILLLLSAANLLTYYSEINKERWRETVDILDRYAGPEDLVVVHSGFCIENAIDFYRRKENMNLFPFPQEHLPVKSHDLAELAGKTRLFQRVWLVESHSRDSTDQILTVLDHEFKCRRLIYLFNRSFNSHKSYAGVKISVWDKKNTYRTMSLPEVRY
jgi:mannosyltransferase